MAGGLARQVAAAKHEHHRAMRSPTPVLCGLLAAIDMGSNSFRDAVGKKKGV